MNKSLLKKIFFYIKIFISFGIIFFIFRKINWNTLYHNLLTIKPVTIFNVIIIAIIKLIMQAEIWRKYLMLNKNFFAKRYDVYRSHFIGLSLKFIAPGGIGMIGKIMTVDNSKKASFFSIGIESFFQVWTNLFYASLALKIFIPIFPNWLENLFIFFIILLPLLLYFTMKLIQINAFKSASQKYIHSLPKILPMLLIHNLLTFAQFYFILNNFIKIRFIDSCVSASLTLVSNLIPITYNGLGLRETFAIKVLSNFGIPSEIAITTTLTSFFFNAFFPALVGLYFILRKHPNENISL